jgi:ABC-type multidrug transport system ATPase subunit
LSIPFEVRALSKSYGKHQAVEALDMRVEEGQIVGFLGPNGAGKSTTLRAAVGLLRPTAGGVKLWGIDVWENRCKALANVGALVETPAFYEYLPARENLRLIARLSGGAPSEEIEQALELVDLAERAGDKVGTFSHGMKQRLALASTMLPKPKLIILDEPTNGLDPQGMAHMRHVLKRLVEEEGITLVVSSHLLHEVQQLCTHIVVINRGKKVLEGSVSELLKTRQPQVKLKVSQPEAAAIALGGSFPEARVREGEDGQLVLEGGEELIPEAVRLLVGAGLDVHWIVPVAETMEDLFIRAVGAEGYDELARS